ncbi:MAG: hypothetical protein JSS65_14425 [Armatimonadetes bacterium]|nr:hypothetical protein [Armatimonadota bacterium]
MKKTVLFAITLAALSSVPFLLTGCNEETKADPGIEKAMNDQRAATAPKGGPTPRPGKTTPGK